MEKIRQVVDMPVYGLFYELAIRTETVTRDLSRDSGLAACPVSPFVGVSLREHDGRILLSVQHRICSVSIGRGERRVKPCAIFDMRLMFAKSKNQTAMRS